MEPKTLKREILERGIKSLMDEAQVPMRQHLKVVEALSKRIQQHNSDIEVNKQDRKEYKDVLKTHKEHNKAHEQQLSDWDTIVKEVLSTDWTGLQGEIGQNGKDGRDGIDGLDADEEKIISTILAKIPIPENGKDGRNGFDGEDGKIELKKVTKLIIKTIKDEQLLDLTHIKGAQKFVKDGVSYKFEELMHGGGSKTTGSGLNYLALQSGAIDNSNTVFTFASTPTIVVVNGASYINGFGVAIVGTKATLDNPAGTGGSVYGLG